MITVPELRAELRLPPEEDHRLEAMRLEVIALWESETGRPWNRVTGYVETIEPTYVPGRDLFLALWPIETVTQVRTLGPDESTWTTLVSTDYLKIGTRVLRRLGTNWPRETTIEVTYTGGVSDAAPDIKRALIVQAAFMKDRLASDKLIVRNVFGGASGATYESADLHPLFARLVKQHARRV